MADVRAISQKYAEIGRKVIEKEEELADIKVSSATIVYLSSEHKKMSEGKVVHAQCEKVADKHKWAISADYTITVFEPNVERMTEEQLYILLFHELMHIEIGMDDNGKELYKIKGHDLEDFKLIIDRFGTDWAKAGE